MRTYTKNMIKMKNNFILIATLLIVTCALIASIRAKSTSEDIYKVIKIKHPDFKKIFYPSTGNSASCIVITKNGDIYYYRMNAFSSIKDEKFLFNIYKK